MRPTRLAFVFALPLLTSLAACGYSTPQPDTAAGDSASFQVTVQPGTPVTVNRGGQWVPATVVRQTAAQKVLIHYEGMPSEWDEDVAFDRVRARQGNAGPSAPGAVYRPGEIVLARTQNKLFVAEMLQQVDAQKYRVHYSGYGPEAVEEVTMDRLQRPYAGQTQYPAGTAVLVEVGTPQPMPAKVLAVVSPAEWIVRFDNYDARYDQLVGPERIQPAALSMLVDQGGAAAPGTTAPPSATIASLDPTKTPPIATTPPAATAKPPVAGPPAPPPLQAGDTVLVQVKSLYYPAKITGAGAAAGAWKVRLDGQAAEEEVAGDRVLRLNDPLKNVKYKTGQQVVVEWHGVYATGKVTGDAGQGVYKVRIDGADTDELVAVKRLRPR